MDESKKMDEIEKHLVKIECQLDRLVNIAVHATPQLMNATLREITIRDGPLSELVVPIGFTS